MATGATSARRRAVHLHAIAATSPFDPPRARRRLKYLTHESNAPHHRVGTTSEDPRDARRAVRRRGNFLANPYLSTEDRYQPQITL